MENKEHLCRRCLLLILSIILGAVVATLICDEIIKNKIPIDENNMVEVSKVMIGVWGTLLGFIITAESILVAFSNGRITYEFKKTGHYMTVIFQYTQTSIKLLLYILIFVIVIVINRFGIREMFLFISCGIMTFIDVFVSFFILILMLKMANKE